MARQDVAEDEYPKMAEALRAVAAALEPLSPEARTRVLGSVAIVMSLDAALVEKLRGSR